jgi:diguanylate cyclase (GGDEF)-like protein
MEDSAPLLTEQEQEEQRVWVREDAAARRRRTVWAWVAAFCLVAAGFGATQFFAARFWSAEVQTVSITLPISIVVLIGLAVLMVIAGAVAVYLARWRLPARRLARTLEEVRRGERPIDDLRLPDSAGGLSPLLPMLREMFKEFRRQKAELAKLELEISERVARRTDALERTLNGLRAQASRDPLTGLLNRRMLDQSLDEVVARCRADRAALCVMMIDLDDFKVLNDTLGHAKGDELLQAVGQLIRSSLREDDLAFRCGGDEFVILFPGASKQHAQGVGRRLTELVDALVKPLHVPRKPRLCIGLSVLGEGWGEPSGKALLALADKRLYATKAVRKGLAA